MNMRVLTSLLSIIIVCFACTGGTEQKAEESNETVVAEQKAETDSVQFYGESFQMEDFVPVASLTERLGENDSIMVTARGEVQEVCQAKGCWMTLKMENGERMRVTFKDYGFFVPKDIAGKEVIMQGKASYTTTDVATLQHLAKDAGKSEEEIAQISEPEVALAFVANGVTVLE